MEIYMKKFFDSHNFSFSGFQSRFYSIYIDFTRIAASNTTDDITN